MIVQEREEVQKLLSRAKGCIPKEGVPILVKQLTKALKLYTMWDGENYMYGKPGDYVAVRRDDPTDVYVIMGRVFEKTYEHV